ncbi:hypothetical protein BS78_04G021500 [Paspalum vaginatum]|nr:hypothetical protein BS78_04G021500 [Paspalum vaginatum]
MPSCPPFLLRITKHPNPNPKFKRVFEEPNFKSSSFLAPIVCRDESLLVGFIFCLGDVRLWVHDSLLLFNKVTTNLNINEFRIGLILAPQDCLGMPVPRV